jgi:hypothetical protein
VRVFLILGQDGSKRDGHQQEQHNRFLQCLSALRHKILRYEIHRELLAIKTSFLVVTARKETFQLERTLDGSARRSCATTLQTAEEVSIPEFTAELRKIRLSRDLKPSARPPRGVTD